MSSPTRAVLIVDDHVEMARLLGDKLGQTGWTCQVVDSGRAALASLETSVPDLVVTDLRMADVDGLDVLDAARRIDAELPVIIMTAFGAIDSAIEAMRRGAWHYLAKPVRLDELVLHANRAFEQGALRRENRLLRGQTRGAMADLVGRSTVMRELYTLVERVALSPAAVLVRGESGTGKELVARAIHVAGPRRNRPFVAINCTAMPEALLESELFGHVRGAFTGATSARPGLFVEANEGTLFLDEIGDMPPSLQAKLLRVLQQGEVRPVGSDESRLVDVRIIAATHHDLEARIQENHFRADLFYRLDVVPIRVPALRERPDDIRVLAEHFLVASRGRNPHSAVERLAPATMSALAGYRWPGNVRELENVIERLVVIGTSPEVSPDELAIVAPTVRADPDAFAVRRDQLLTLREVEEEYIAWAIERCQGNKTRAAEVLGIDPSTLHRRFRPKR
ncbi:MAG: sigma-54-dependent Fis family transcriptional regulator [Deltaproteobacteria bacterium]|nr:sigma-54-dependent Fis family transcriptional regulator [Deltaproteobacteria bacterium]